jgi:hypothetical protein
MVKLRLAKLRNIDARKRYSPPKDGPHPPINQKPKL